MFRILVVEDDRELRQLFRQKRSKLHKGSIAGRLCVHSSSPFFFRSSAT